MTSSNKQHAALITRDAHHALLELKRLVDNAAREIHTAELESVAVAMGSIKGHDPLKPLRAAVGTLQSSSFAAAVSEARSKVENAVACHLTSLEP
jgi:hypothetical protein